LVGLNRAEKFQPCAVLLIQRGHLCGNVSGAAIRRAVNGCLHLGFAVPPCLPPEVAPAMRCWMSAAMTLRAAAEVPLVGRAGDNTDIPQFQVLQCAQHLPFGRVLHASPSGLTVKAKLHSLKIPL